MDSETESPALALITPILAEVLSYCDLATQCIASLVCKQWRAVFEHLPTDDPIQFVSVLMDQINTMGSAWQDKGFAHEDKPRSAYHDETSYQEDEELPCTLSDTCTADIASLSRFLSKHATKGLTMRAPKDLSDMKQRLKNPSAMVLTREHKADDDLPKALDPAVGALVCTAVGVLDVQSLVQVANMMARGQLIPPVSVTGLITQQASESYFGSLK